MTRRGNSSSTLYISTDPNNNVPIGTPGQGVAIGRLGVLLFASQNTPLSGMLITEDTANDLITEDTGQSIHTET